MTKTQPQQGRTARVASMAVALPLALILALPLAAAAQEPAATEGIPQAKIAVINFGQVYSDSLLGKSYAAKIEALDNQIQAEGTKIQAELQKKDAEIEALREELRNQASLLSPEATSRKEQEIRQKARVRQGYLEDSQAEIQRMQETARAQAQNLNNEFQLLIRPYIQEVAKEKGIDILLDGNVALTVTDSFDISREVIVKADDAERAKASAPAAAAAAAPEPTPES